MNCFELSSYFDMFEALWTLWSHWCNLKSRIKLITMIRYLNNIDNTSAFHKFTLLPLQWKNICMYLFVTKGGTPVQNLTYKQY